MKHAVLVLAGIPAVLAVAGEARDRAPQRPPIIDMHMHAHEPAFVPAGAPSICRPAPCQGDGHATATSEESLRKTLDQMKRHNIVLGFLSGDLETVQAWTSQAPDRFLPAPFMLKPGTPPVAQLRKEFAAGRLKGMGEIAAQLSGVAPNDPALAPYFALAAERDVPVLVHTLGIGPELPTFRSAAGNPLLLEDVLVRHPDLRIYIENSGYPFLGETIAMMTQYPQLHGDVSTITWILPRAAFHRYLKGLVDAGLGKRVMFGSDQMRWPEKIGSAIEAIEAADFLTASQKRDIFHDNAARFLGLTGEGRPPAR